MKYFIIISGNYILGLYKSMYGSSEITEEEYNRIYAIIMNAPEAEEGKGYRLRTDLTWEEYDIPPEEEE